MISDFNVYFNRQEVVNSIVDEIGLLHPIYYDVLKNYEVPFTAKDRKKNLVQHLAIFVEKCSCFL